MFLLLCSSMPDHHLTTTVQWCCKISEKPIVTTNNGLFLVLEATVQNQHNLRFTFQRQSIPPCRSSPTRKARGSNPPGRTKSSTLWGVALFVLHGFYGAAKGRIRTVRAPRFASRGAETPQWELSVFRCLHDEPVPPATRQTPAGPPRCSNRQGWPGRMPAPDGQ